jgi:putative flippase GtrA
VLPGDDGRVMIAAMTPAEPLTPDGCASGGSSGEGTPGRSERLAARFAAVAARVAAALPLGLDRVVSGSMVGFAVINGFTFGVDLLVLTALHGGLGLPLGVAVTLGYAGAFGLGFVLNRRLNFRSHAPVGRQLGWYAAAVVVDYAVVLLGVTQALAAVGAPYQLARVAAGAGEAVFMYCALRWVVFRPQRAEGGSR